MVYIGFHALPYPSPGQSRDIDQDRYDGSTAPLQHTRNQNRAPKLARRTKPYWHTVAPGISVGYRRNAGPGTWNVRCADGKGGNWIKSLDAIADDHEDSDAAANVLDFWQAVDKAKALARGSDADAGRPATVDEALTDYATELAVNNKNPTNATHPRHHLTPALLSKPVSLLNGPRTEGVA